MDISLNQVDLQYLTNPHEMAKVAKLRQTSSRLFPHADINFYRKRIFQLTKAYLTGEKRNPSLDQAFYSYAEECVKHFQFRDKSEIIQRDYSEVKRPKSVGAPISIDETNRKFLTTRDKGPPHIANHMKIVRKTTKPKMIVPQARSYRLKGEEFRTKRS